jgi:hypothetical protein
MVDTDPRVEETQLTADQIGASIPWLRERLAAAGIGVHPASDLSRAFTAMDQFLSDVSCAKSVFVRGPEQFQTFAERFAAVCGIDFLSKALHRTWGQVQGAERHLRYLASADPLPTAPTRRSGDKVQERNLVWELGLAALVAAVATETALEDPPDVTFTFSASRVGIAAKYLYSDEPRKQTRRIAEGLAQIERSNVESGYVILNLVQQFPLGPMLHNFSAGHLDVQRCTAVVDQWSIIAMDPAVRRLAHAVRLSPKTKAILSFIPFVCPHNSSIAPLYRWGVISIPGREADASEFIDAFHDASQTVLQFTQLECRDRR